MKCVYLLIIGCSLVHAMEEKKTSKKVEKPQNTKNSSDTEVSKDKKPNCFVRAIACCCSRN